MIKGNLLDLLRVLRPPRGRLSSARFDHLQRVEVGIANLGAVPKTWWAQMLSVFRWARIKAESATPVA